MNIPVIDLPQDSQKRLSYMTNLDSSSLKGEDRCQSRPGSTVLTCPGSVEQGPHRYHCIHASPRASGSLIRLLGVPERGGLRIVRSAPSHHRHASRRGRANSGVSTGLHMAAGEWQDCPAKMNQLSLRHPGYHDGA